ncbi:MAG: MBL fold metallo-hydrolase [Rhizobiales bacterium]|nr:MBL fold metallo-hydrolase [Hyphomicrobiales bacterium]
MLNLTRRNMLAATAAAGAAATLGLDPRTAGAAAPAATTQVPSVYRYKIGTMEVTVVSDGMRDAPLGQIVRNAPADEVAAALEAAFLPKDKFPFVFNPSVVNTGSKLVVIDTGNGPGAYAQTKGQAGQMHTNLVAAGIDRAMVDLVIISHFHGDHINGLLTAEGTPAFPNAEVAVPEPEWAFWMSDDNMNKAPEGLKAGFSNVRRVFKPLGDRVSRYGDKKELAPGITSMFTPGHTPGHSSHVLASGGQSVVLQADVTNHPALFVRNPGWHGTFDMDANVAEATRRRLYDQLAADRSRLQGFHFPFPSNGYVEKDGNGYRFVAAQWSPVL